MVNWNEGEGEKGQTAGWKTGNRKRGEKLRKRTGVGR